VHVKLLLVRNSDLRKIFVSKELAGAWFLLWSYFTALSKIKVSYLVLPVINVG
jgi:hypothetical protein